MKTCRTCNQTKPADAYRGTRSACRECEKARRREWYAAQAVKPYQRPCARNSRRAGRRIQGRRPRRMGKTEGAADLSFERLMNYTEASPCVIIYSDAR